MNCASCDYWRPDKAVGNEVFPPEVGLCLRHSPKAFKYYTDRGRSEVITEWPTTKATDWCGDYQRHPTRRLAE